MPTTCLLKHLMCSSFTFLLVPYRHCLSTLSTTTDHHRHRPALSPFDLAPAAVIYLHRAFDNTNSAPRSRLRRPHSQLSQYTAVVRFLWQTKTAISFPQMAAALSSPHTAPVLPSQHPKSAISSPPVAAVPRCCTLRLHYRRDIPRQCCVTAHRGRASSLQTATMLCRGTLRRLLRRHKSRESFRQHTPPPRPPLRKLRLRSHPHMSRLCPIAPNTATISLFKFGLCHVPSICRHYACRSLKKHTTG